MALMEGSEKVKEFSGEGSLVFLKVYRVLLMACRVPPRACGPPPKPQTLGFRV